jgi:hypothetical protein
MGSGCGPMWMGWLMMLEVRGKDRKYDCDAKLRVLSLAFEIESVVMSELVL